VDLDQCVKDIKYLYDKGLASNLGSNSEGVNCFVVYGYAYHNLRKEKSKQYIQ
jgi:hypothetical protein